MAANHLLKSGLTTTFLISSHHNHVFFTHTYTYTFRFPSFSLLSLSSTSHLPSPPLTTTRRLLCTTSTTTETAADATSAVVAVKETAGLLDIRVGKVLKAWQHPDAESLYVEEVDVGEVEPRTICSGLVKFLPVDHLQDKKVIVLANLKPRNMRGIKSNGMLMAASDASHENVELLVPPEDSVPGERIWFGSEEDRENQPAAASPNQIQKKKVWEAVQPHLKTDDACVAMLDGHFMRTSAGPVVSRTLKNANIS